MKVIALKVDLTKLINGSSNALADNNITIQPLDIIYVPKTFFANVSIFLRQVYDGVLPPLDMYIRVLW